MCPVENATALFVLSEVFLTAHKDTSSNVADILLGVPDEGMLEIPIDFFLSGRKH